MSVDKHTLQKWIAGAELRLKKSRRPFARVPLLNRIKQVARTRQSYTLTEQIDLTRARNFCAQATSEDILFASIDLPLLGKQGIGNDVGLAVASFHYTDREGDEHKLVAVCAYHVSGVVRKTREFKHAIVIPVA
jgi:hypothetical protein